MKEPAKNPCGSCPYRRDVPSGIWAEEEYDKLPRYDLPMVEQPQGVFACHQFESGADSQRICAGWAGVHDMDDNLALRLWGAFEKLTEDVIEKTRNYTTDVPLFETGEEARQHGIAEIENPSAKAKAKVQRIINKRSDVSYG